MQLLPRLLFLSSLAILLLMLAGFFVSGSTTPMMAPHPDHPTILISKTAHIDQGQYVGLGYAIGLSIIALMVASIFLGNRKAGKRTPIHQWMGWGSVIYVIIFSLMTYSYWDYSQLGNTSFFGGFPLPSAWMIYGIWLSPLLLAAVIIWGFDRWIFTPKDLEDFQELVAENKRNNNSTS